MWDQFKPFSRDELFEFQGIWMNHYYTDNWDNVQSFQAKPDDIVILSFPRSGHTWTSHIVELLCYGIPPENAATVEIFKKVPTLEISLPLKNGDTLSGTKQIHAITTSPRLIKSHLPAQLFPKSFWENNCKLVYVARNPKDVMVSYYHFERMFLLNPDPGDWSSYFQRFLQGKMVYGSWYDHVNNWWKKKETYPNLHFIFYEDIIKNPKQEIDRLCSFLGLCRSSEEKDRIVAKVQFDEMKENQNVNFSTFPGMDFSATNTFIRKGRVGNWMNHFTVAQNEEFDKDFKKKMESSTFPAFLSGLTNTP